MDNRNKIATRFAIAGVIFANLNKYQMIASGEYYISDQAQFWLQSILLNSVIVIGIWYGSSYGILTLIRNRKLKKMQGQIPTVVPPVKTGMETRKQWAIGLGAAGAIAPFLTMAQRNETPHIYDVIIGGGVNYLLVYGIGTILMKINKKRKLRKYQSYSGAPLPPPNIN